MQRADLQEARPRRSPTRPISAATRPRKLWVEKVETAADGPDKGKVQSVTTIRAIDATIFDNGQGNDNSTVVARGPGILEIRPARDKPGRAAGDLAGHTS